MSDPFSEVLAQKAPKPQVAESPFNERMGQLQPAQRKAPEAQPFAAPVMRSPEDPTLIDKVIGTAKGIPEQFARVGRGISNAVGGFDRQTRATRALPELSEVGVDAILGPNLPASQKVAVSAALATTFDVEEAAKILRSANPDLGVSFDERGNVMITNNQSGVSAVINKPGLSKTDALQAVGTAAAFTPAARGGSAIGVGLKSGATQGAIETAQTAAGGDFDTREVAVAGGGGAMFQGLFNRLAQSFPSLRQAGVPVTEEVLESFRREAVKVGIDPSLITEEAVRRAAAQSRQAATPQTAEAVALEGEFNIPFSQGQRTLDPSQIEFEDLARTGTLGEDARAPLLDLQRTQRDASQVARQDMADNLSPTPVSRREAGEVVGAGIRSEEQALDRAVQQAYESVGDASLSPDGFRRLLIATRQALRGPEFDRTLPETRKVLNQISKRLQLEQKLEQSGARPKAVSIREIDQIRKRLGTAIDAAENNADRRQLTRLKAAYDSYLDEAVIDGLFSGDEQALSQLKEARGLFREYARKFREQKTRVGSGRREPDPAGRFIESIVAENPTGEQVINAVFGANGLQKGSGAALANRFKEILGPDSEEWNSLRRAAFDRLIRTRTINGEEVISGSRTLSEIDKAMDKGESLMTTLFAPEEIALMRRFATAVQRTDPQIERSRLQPSGNIRAIRQIAGRLGGAFGDASLFILSEGAERVSTRRAASRATDAASRPFERVRPARASLTAGAIGASSAATGDTSAPVPEIPDQ